MNFNKSFFFSFKKCIEYSVRKIGFDSIITQNNKNNQIQTMLTKKLNLITPVLKIILPPLLLVFLNVFTKKKYLLFDVILLCIVCFNFKKIQSSYVI